MMDMNAIVWILLLVWTIICHAMTSGGTTDILGAPPPVPSYPIVRFRADNPQDEASYGVMIARLRELLTTQGGFSQGIPVLRESNSVNDAERYILVEMSVVVTGSPQPQAVTFAINVVNVYMVGYLDGRTDTRHLFQEGEEHDPSIRRLLFTGARATSPRTISTNYQRLENMAGSRRTNIALGLHALEASVRALLGGQGGPQQARAIIVVLQSVTEAVRYWAIERAVRQDGSVPPSEIAIALENNWSSLSLEIQRSDGFAFQQPVVLEANRTVADNMLASPVRALFLMLYICPHLPRLAAPAAVVSLSSEPHYHGRGRGRGLELLQQVTMRSSHDNQDQCTVSNPRRARIIGRDGLCVDVESFRYSDNNPVVLFTCRTSDMRNQLWTWMHSDGRIMSLEKCLTASGNNPGSPVVIRECDILDSGSPSRWRMDDHGTLIHVYSKLVLTATSGSIGSRLTVEKPTSSSFQAWQSTNVTVGAAGSDVMIVGERNQCIYYNGRRGVYSETCSGGQVVAARQRWRLYPDGTVRPIDWLNGCLEVQRMPRSRYNYIQAGRCDTNPESHRWIFTNTGAIQNLASDLVVDADKDHPGYLQAAIYVQGAGNQIWRTRFLNA